MQGQSTVTGVPMYNRRNEIIPNGCNLGHSGPHSNAPHVGGSCKRCSSSNILVLIGGSAARDGELQQTLGTSTRHNGKKYSCDFNNCLVEERPIWQEWRTVEYGTLPLKTLRWYTDRSKPNLGTGTGVAGPSTSYYESMGIFLSSFQAELHAIDIEWCWVESG